ncbi:uncharacterized protein LY89DRAFT_314076 [Mollisia scopiformis]|uniref:Telomerase reverse transcriptase n=1 Tax=Mollisia scopiformis TaxID=149040 RepID=A0A194XRZ0_MOLSC|nr:uncharacterized protein LY89DRAFT_314076 [Mollisia scopiformis]KUJ22916.1 hypothetical protein LY89DRAFT_314076 [Mollisia scopiformis]
MILIDFDVCTCLPRVLSFRFKMAGANLLFTDTFKIQAHAMFLDTSFNSLKTVLSNVYSAFIESATKMWTYAKCLPAGKQPGTQLILKTIRDLIELAFVLMKSKGKNKKNVGYKFALSKMQVECNECILQHLEEATE